MNLEELLLEAEAAEGPRRVDRNKVRPGGVDPLGLRQINFDLMDMVLPNLNNVARHIRPFTVVAWGWRRVRQLLERSGASGADDAVMRDFVDRIEAIFAWSQFVLDPRSDLPGAQALGPLIHAQEYRFHGELWERRRDVRRYSTGIIAPVNYGPALKALGWIIEAGPPGVFVANPDLDPALDAFEALLGVELNHAAFSKFSDVTVERTDVERWGPMWAMDRLTPEEMEAAFVKLSGPETNPDRRRGCQLIVAAVAETEDDYPETDAVRAMMAKGRVAWPGAIDLAPTAEAWRRVQVRQVFRLALESLFYWVVNELLDDVKDTEALVLAFLREIEANLSDLPATAREWIAQAQNESGPTDHLEALQGALAGKSRSSLPSVIVDALAHSIAEAPEKGEAFERSDRLPLVRAKNEFEAWADLPPAEFMARIIEVWILAQHAYWCVGRGLADARSRGKSILRLRVVMDEGGWTVTPGTTWAPVPNPTPDRLITAMTLLDESGRLIF